MNRKSSMRRKYKKFTDQDKLVEALKAREQTSKNTQANPPQIEENSSNVNGNGALQLAMKLSNIQSEEIMEAAFENPGPITIEPIVTEHLTFPNTELVGFIVGKNFTKLLELQQSTNTQIRAPQYNEKSVFAITGTASNVADAILKILIDLEKVKTRVMPSEKTIHFKLPGHVVGVLIGQNGETIQRIQEHTNTKIMLKFKDREAIFQVTGQTLMVEEAQRLFIEHLTANARPDLTPSPAFLASLRSSWDFLSPLPSPISCSPKSSTSSTSSWPDSIDNQTKKCMICSQNDISTVLVPCGHYKFCYQCAIEVACPNKFCPDCNVTILYAMQVTY